MSVSRPKEQIVEYGSLPAPYLTPFCQEMDRQYGNIETFSKILQFSRRAASELGEWCADHLWSVALVDEEATRLQRRAEQLFRTSQWSQPIKALDDELKRIGEALEHVKSHSFSPPSMEGKSLSSKVRSLHGYLSGIYERPTEAKCIIFVKRRYTARILGELFSRIGSPHLRLGLLIGTRTGEAGDIKVTFRQQVLTLMKFRRGDLNCLVGSKYCFQIGGLLTLADCNIYCRRRTRYTGLQYYHQVFLSYYHTRG